jgi:hypothetical protein
VAEVVDLVELANCWGDMGGGHGRILQRTALVRMRLPNGLELSRLASPRILSNAKPNTGLARSAPASCWAADIVIGEAPGVESGGH